MRELTQDATQILPTRQEQLLLWMRRSHISFVQLADGYDIHPSQLARLCGQETMPVRHHAYLVGCGVPVELLPRAEDQKPGPKPKAPHGAFRGIPHDEAMSAFRGA